MLLWHHESQTEDPRAVSQTEPLFSDKSVRYQVKPRETERAPRKRVKKRFGHLILWGVFRALFHILSPNNPCFFFLKAFAVQRGQISWIIISMDKWGKEDRSLRWLLKRRAESWRYSVTHLFNSLAFFSFFLFSVWIILSAVSQHYKSQISVDKEQSRVLSERDERRRGQYEVCFFWKSRRKTDTEKVCWCAKACDALPSWEIIAIGEEMA